MRQYTSTQADSSSGKLEFVLLVAATGCWRLVDLQQHVAIRFW
jgi:hypothetical protein